MKLLEKMGINNHAIKLQKDKHPSYGPIYTLRLIDQKIPKTYIETYLKTRFIQFSKFSLSASILFDKKLDNRFYLCINYQELINLTITNQYSVPFIGKSLNCLGQAKKFTQLDLTSIYYQIRIKENNK